MIEIATGGINEQLRQTLKKKVKPNSLFKVVLPQIPAFTDEQLKHAASEIFKSMRYGLVIHRDNDR